MFRLYAFARCIPQSGIFCLYHQKWGFSVRGASDLAAASPTGVDMLWWLCVFEEAAILDSHGIEVQSPGGQSVSDEVDGNEFPDQVILRWGGYTLPLGTCVCIFYKQFCLHFLSRALTQACEASLLDKRASARQLAFSRADLSSPTQVRPTNLQTILSFPTPANLPSSLSTRFPHHFLAGFLLWPEEACQDSGASLWLAALCYRRRSLQQKVPG